MPNDEEEMQTFLVPVPSTRRGDGKMWKGERDAEAARLKALNWDILDIAKHLGLDQPNPEHAIERTVAAIRRAMARAVRFAGDEERHLQLQSLDELELRLWKLLDNGTVLVQQGRIIEMDGIPLDDHRFALEVVDRIVKVKDQRHKLLGTYAPTRVETLTIDSVEAEIERLQKELASGTTPQLEASVQDAIEDAVPKDYED
jgi:hypothetical protein